MALHLTSCEQPDTLSDTNKLARYMFEHGLATGHGDTTDGLISELDWQVRELRDVRGDLLSALKTFLAFDSAAYDRGSHRAKALIETKKIAWAAVAKVEGK